MALFKHDRVKTEGAVVDRGTSSMSRTSIIKGGTYSNFGTEQEEEPQAGPEEGPIQEEAVALQDAPPPPPPPQPQVDRMIIEEAEKKAEEIIRKARAEAKKLIEETKLYSQSAFSQAERDGFVKGKEDGFEAGREEMSNVIKEAKNVLDQAFKERELLFRSIEPEVAKLAIRIAEKIIQTQVDTNEDIVINMIRGSLEKVKQRDEVIIKVNQADYDYAKERKDIFARMVEGLKNMDIVVDPGVEKGGCIIETNLGNVDARISTQIHTLELAFEQVEKGGGDENEKS